MRKLKKKKNLFLIWEDFLELAEFSLENWGLVGWGLRKDSKTDGIINLEGSHL